MLSVDTSTFVAYLQGNPAEDVIVLKKAIRDERLILSPFVLTELFSAPNLSQEIKDVIRDLPSKPIIDGFWERAGEARASILKMGKKARTLDTLIAIYCLDHDMPLITRDGDYRHFVEHFGLRLMSGEIQN